ncbi:DUF7716 domain-containing protein [Undibacterium sp. SXout11W]|uniref:DUF7716 domain-containing protein n=1 Tax=Undibacterium sp. SXout11W TaxID=3413050 RepID=UPI003BF3E41F
MLLQLRQLFARVKAENMCAGWIYFRENLDPTLDTECLLVMDDDFEDDFDGIPSKARTAGFGIEGLDTSTIEDCLRWAKHLEPKSGPALELESFVYYWRFDAFLPRPGAPAPPPPDVAMMNFDRKFYDELGEENISNPCRIQDCGRGAIQYSVFCRVHHFESIRKKPCPFSD